MTAREVMVALARRYAFGDLQALAEQHPAARGISGTDRGAAGIEGLCAFGQRVLDLDAEDFGVPEEAGEVPEDLLARARASRMPQSPRERPRGALASLRPAYALLLEAIAIRWERREMAALTAAVHIAAEYLPLLAWEPVLGHAGDPALLAGSVTGDGSLFGRRPEQGDARRCDHGATVRSACERALRVSLEPATGWRAYLDRQHSQLADALGICAARCRRPCSVVMRIDAAERAALTGRCRLAREFADGALVRLRHAAPVGHGFGVPSPAEVQQAWARSRMSLARDEPGRRALAGAGNDGYPLGGLPGLFSAIAGAPIVPDTLLTDVAARIEAVIEGAGC